MPHQTRVGSPVAARLWRVLPWHFCVLGPSTPTKPEPILGVILSHDHEPILPRVLEPVFAQDFSPVEVIVVDGASAGGSAAMLRARFPRAKVIELAENAARCR